MPRQSRLQGTSGKLIERLIIEENVPDPIGVASITRTSTTATVTTAVPHGYASGDYATVAGAVPTGYNGKVKITVTGANTFTYPVLGSLTTPATGTITVVYVSDAQGGKRVSWATHATIAAEAIPIDADERLAAASIPAFATTTRYRFRTWARVDLTDQMRVRWTPTWPPDAPERVLEITGLIGEDDGRRFMYLECVE